jgi:Zn-dependent peptidase ImmA (M78 family)
MTFKVSRKKNGLPYLSKNNIEEITALYLSKFNADLLKEPTPIPIEEFLENHLKLDMDYADITNDASILGLIAFDSGYLNVYDLEHDKQRVIYVEEGTVVIDNSLLQSEKEKRYRFTCGHEGGHWIFHREMFRYQKKVDIFNCEEVRTAKHLNTKNENDFKIKRFQTDEEWMEWQADYAAACILMPKKTFIMAAHKIFKEAGIKDEYVVLDEDYDVDLFSQYVNKKMASIFKVSIKAASIRLKELNLIKYMKILTIIVVLAQLSNIFFGSIDMIDVLGNT